VTRALRIALIAGAAALVALPLFGLFLRMRAGDSRIIEPEPFDYALLVISVVGIVLGAQMVPWRAASDIGLVAVCASTCLLFGLLAAFSIGLAFIPAGAILLLLLARALRRRPAQVANAAAIGGSFIGYGVVLLYLALVVPAVVECFPNGAGTSSGRWGGSGPRVVSGGISVRPDGVATGRVDAPTYAATFRCESGRVVEFERIPR